jgi:Domain of unknown function (DUF4384)
MRGHATRPMLLGLVAVLSLLGTIVDPAQIRVAESSAAEPLRAVLHLRVDDPNNPHRRNVRLDQPGALPLIAGDRFRIEARLSRPAYLYLFWIGSDAKVAPIYPWKRGQWNERPADEQRNDRLDLPPKADDAWEIPAGKPGIETLLLLVREEILLPRKDEESLTKLLAGARIPMEPLIKEAVWLENGREVTIDPQDRAVPGKETRKSDDPVLSIRRLLQEKVRPLGDYYQAIVFPDRGGS